MAHLSILSSHQADSKRFLAHTITSFNWFYAYISHFATRRFTHCNALSRKGVFALFATKRLFQQKNPLASGKGVCI
jgi:hypothetical protein